MKRIVFVLVALLFLVPSFSSAGNIFIEEGDLFIAKSLDSFLANTGLNPSIKLQGLSVGETITAKVTNPQQASKFFGEQILMNEGVGIKRIEEDVLDLAYGKIQRRVKVTGKLLGRLNHIFE